MSIHSSTLSVLALSSRFDGPFCPEPKKWKQALSVLALSSRFDGPLSLALLPHAISFQYSLCRVVLMVLVQMTLSTTPHFFQYSLCRVVLMVAGYPTAEALVLSLSVLALSSRFDGPALTAAYRLHHWPFSTRSVESF